MTVNESGRSLIGVAQWRGETGLAIVGLVLVLTLAGRADAASPDPLGPAERFESARFGYALTLPPGWEVVEASQASADFDQFRGPGLVAAVAAALIEPGQTVDDRLAVTRSNHPECTSDPSSDVPATLGGEEAIRWPMVCPNSVELSLSVIHGPRVYRLHVIVPLGSEELAGPVLDQLAASFAFTDAGGSLPSDAATLADRIQGTWQNAWHPVALELAAVRAAGLGDELDASQWIGLLDPAASSRYAVKFDGTEIIQYTASDGGAFELGWLGTFEPLDADTIEATENGTLARIVLDLALQEDVLSVDVVSDSGGPEDLVIQTAFNETLPFVRVP
jgi:hypothetical protein